MVISQALTDFVRRHASDDVNTLRLKYSGNKSLDMDFSLDFALLQIEARRKTRKKIPYFIDNPLFVFPTLLSAEQASNETVAKFHASLISSGSTVLDLTAGLGIDDMTFARNGIRVTACEIDEFKCEALKHNASLFGLSDLVSVNCVDSIEFLRTNFQHFDVVFADPARRDSKGGRLHALADCQPDILDAMPEIMSVASRVLIKCSPLLDLSLIRQSVENLRHIYVVCFKGECKEVLIDIRKNDCCSGVTVVNLDLDKVLSCFESSGSPQPGDSATLVYADRKSPVEYRYLYEPNAGVMKTGDWHALEVLFPEIRKADANTHIFFSDTLYEAFPGRVMRILSEPDKRTLKTLKKQKMNVVSRNHPLSAQEISKRLSVIPGSDRILYALRYRGNPCFVITEFTQVQG